MEIIDRPMPLKLAQKNIFFINRKLYILLLAIISAINIPIASFITVNDGGFKTQSEALLGTVVVSFIGLPILSLILAVLFSLRPYKEQSYNQKYIPVALIIYLILNIILLLISIGGLVAGLSNGALKL